MNYKVTMTGHENMTLLTDEYQKALKYYTSLLARLQRENDHHQDVTLFRKDQDYFKVMDRRYQFEEQKGKCQVCGCHWYKACAGGCSWVKPELCSKCAEKGVTHELSWPLK